MSIEIALEQEAAGFVTPDDEFGKQIGFTSDKFDGWLFRNEDRVMISFIESLRPGSGNLSALFKAIEDFGLRVAVPTPFGKMRSILARKGFAPHMEHDVEMGAVDVWEKGGASQGK